MSDVPRLPPKLLDILQQAMSDAANGCSQGWIKRQIMEAGLTDEEGRWLIDWMRQFGRG
jgi:hypothetical protein